MEDIYEIEMKHSKNTKEVKITDPRWFIIPPGSKPKLFWDSLIIILALYNAFTIPMTVAFDSIQRIFDESLSYFDLAVDILYFIDIFLAFITAFVRKSTGDYIYSPKLIAKRYVTSSFIVDFLSVVPVISEPILQSMLFGIAKSLEDPNQSANTISKLES